MLPDSLAPRSELPHHTRRSRPGPQAGSDGHCSFLPMPCNSEASRCQRFLAGYRCAYNIFTAVDDIVIRHSQHADLDGIVAIYRERHAYSNTLQMPYASKTQWERRLANDSPGVISLVALRDDEIVGQLTLVRNENLRRRHVATFGMGVLAAQTGRGVGSRLLEAALDLADNWLDVERIEIEVYVDNASAIALYKKYGFEIEGTLQKYAFRDGSHVDAHAMARFRHGPNET